MDLPWTIQGLLSQDGVRKLHTPVARKLCWQERGLIVKESKFDMQYVWQDQSLHEDLDLSSHTQVAAICAEIALLTTDGQPPMRLEGYSESVAIAICYMACRTMCRMHERFRATPVWKIVGDISYLASSCARSEVERWAREQPYWRAKSSYHWDHMSESGSANEGSVLISITFCTNWLVLTSMSVYNLSVINNAYAPA